MKKIYIHTDHEGVSGVNRGEMILKDDKDYRFSVERLMADVNAAVDGAFLGGADHVTVMDGHGGGGNFDLSLLDPRAEFDARPDKSWHGKIDESYWGSFMVGMHAMAGTLNGFLDHTRNSRTIYNYYINGRKMGEIGQWGVVCAHFGVPVIMVCGDESGVNEAAQFYAGCETAAVKRGVSRGVATLAGYEDALDKIRAAAKRAVEKPERAKPLKPILPMEIKIEYYRCDFCEDYLAANEKYERVDARTLRMISDCYLNII